VAEVVWLPAASRARALSVCVPLLAEALFQLIEYGAVVSSAPSATPSSRNCTPTTPTLSLALAVTLTVALTVAPPAGALTLTVGPVVSGTALDTVTLRAAEVVWLPAASRARAVRECVPLPAVVVFQLIV